MLELYSTPAFVRACLHSFEGWMPSSLGARHWGQSGAGWPAALLCTWRETGVSLPSACTVGFCGAPSRGQVLDLHLPGPISFLRSLPKFPGRMASQFSFLQPCNWNRSPVVLPGGYRVSKCHRDASLGMHLHAGGHPAWPASGDGKCPAASHRAPPVLTAGGA